MDQALVSFKLCNNSNKTYIIPSVISYNSISDKNPNINIGYEVYRKEESKNSFVLLDSCFIHNNPLIPEEGIVINKYKRRNRFFYESQLPINCIYKKGSYKII